MKNGLWVLLVLICAGLVMWWAISLASASSIFFPLLLLFTLGFINGYNRFFDGKRGLETLNTVCCLLLGFWAGQYCIHNLWVIAPIVLISILGCFGGFAANDFDI